MAVLSNILTRYPFCRRLERNRDGATAVEFAIVALPFFLFLFAVFEFGLYTWTQVAIESALQQTAREASLGTNGQAQGYKDRVEYIQETTKNKLTGLPGSGNIAISSAVVTAPGIVVTKVRDMCIGHPSGSLYPPTCDCGSCQVIDKSPPAGYQSSADDLGGSGDMVEIRVSYAWKILFPIIGPMIGDENGYATITSTVVVKNEPF